MVRIKISVGDNDDSHFHETVEANIESIDYLVYKDCMDVCSPDEYDAAWDRICEAIGRQNSLPSGWYQDGELELV